MMKKYALVPVSIAERADEKQSEDAQMQAIAKLLPKNTRSRAKIILFYLAKHGTQMDRDTQRIKYDDGTISSHLLDLVRFVVTPDNIKLRRPIDTPHFFKLLVKAGVPSSVFGKGKDMDAPAWVSLYK